MSEIASISQKVEDCFNHILVDRMEGMPILNTALKVQTLEFQPWEGRVIGLVITPWLMNLVLLPNADDDWEGMELGEKVTHAFPNRDLDFQVNEVEGLGYCQTYAIYSPMAKFPDQASAVAAAEQFMKDLMVAAERVSDSIDEQRMKRYLDGEDMAQIRADEEAEKERIAALERESIEEKMDKPLSRRELLRGSFIKETS